MKDNLLFKNNTVLRKLAGIACGVAVFGLTAQVFGATAAFEERFTNTRAPAANSNLAAIDWKVYGGEDAADISNVSGRDLSSLLVATGPGNPADGSQFLAVILAGAKPSYPSYAIVKTGLKINAPSLFEWRMNANTGATVRLRLLVQVGGKWYASDVSDTPKSYFEPTSFGDSAAFAAAPEVGVLKRFAFSRDGIDWRFFTLVPGVEMKLGAEVDGNLPAGPVTGIGFYILGGNTGRIDTVRIYQ